MQTSSPPRVPEEHWLETFYVRAYEADQMGWATPLSICNYLQEAASNHAFKLGLAFGQGAVNTERTWVLARLRVRMRRYPVWREPVRICTWPSGLQGYYAFRDFLILDATGNEYGRAVSEWFRVDVKSMRPVKVREPMLQRLVAATAAHPVMERDMDRLPAVENPGWTRRFEVRMSDLDVNQHVNNVNYLDWACETLPDALRCGRMARLDIVFRAAGLAGDVVGVRTACEQENRYIHQIVRESDGRTLAQARTEWMAAESTPPRFISADPPAPVSTAP